MRSQKSSFTYSLYFGASNITGTTRTYSLMKIDTTTLTLSEVKQISSFETGTAIIPNNFFKLNGQIYFRAQADGESVRFWTTDGTQSGTYSLDLGPFTSINTSMSTMDGYFYFTGEMDSNVGVELYKSDGTKTGTSLVKDITLGEDDTVFGSFLSELGIVANNKMMIVIGGEPWITDGTSSGTKLLRDINSSGDGFLFNGGILAGNDIIFSGLDSDGKTHLMLLPTD